MPAIAHDIGGLQLYGLAFSAFFLAGLASIPVTGWAADRYGPARPFLAIVLIFLAGTLVCSLAPSMPVLVLGRLIQGYGAGPQFTITQSVVTRVYAPGQRVRYMTLSSTMWTVPTLIGPALGAFITAWVGWRWAFAVILLPALAALLLTYPRLRTIGPGGGTGPVPLARPLLVAVGVGLVVTGLSSTSWFGLAMVAVGVPAALWALRSLLPEGTFRAREGLPANVATAFLLNLAFYSAAAFVPLVLTQLRGVPLAIAGIAVSSSTLAWSASVWLNSRLLRRGVRPALVRGPGLLLAAAIAVFDTALVGAPLPLAYAACALSGAGIGMAFNTLLLAGMALSPAGSEGAMAAARMLSGNLGTSLGTGLGGAAVAASVAFRAGLRPGLVATYAMAVLAALAVAALAGRSTPHSRA